MLSYTKSYGYAYGTIACPVCEPATLMLEFARNRWFWSLAPTGAVTQLGLEQVV